MSNNILVIGATNIDIFAKTTEAYVLEDSNLANINMAIGGVGGNITTNLANLGLDVSFISAFGGDEFSHLAKKHFLERNVDLTHSLCLKDASSSIYLAILDEKNDLYLGLNDMEISTKLDIPYFKSIQRFIDTFETIVIDNNLSLETIAYLLHTYSHKQIIMDAVSAKKATKLIGLLKYISILKVNKLELSVLSTKSTLNDQINDVLSQGLETIVVTNKDEEIIVQTKDNKYTKTPYKIEQIVNASGAGDAFISGFTYGVTSNEDIDNSINYGALLAYLTLQVNKSTLEKVNIHEELSRI